MKMILPTLLMLSLWASATPTKGSGFSFVMTGKVLQMDKDFVQIAQAGGKTVWIPKSTVIGSVKVNSEIKAVVTSDDLIENEAQLVKRNKKI